MSLNEFQYQTWFGNDYKCTDSLLSGIGNGSENNCISWFGNESCSYIYYQCSEDPILGSEIRVKWSKREIYSARVIGFTTVPQYVVGGRG